MDLDEIVNYQGYGNRSLRRALLQFKAFPPPPSSLPLTVFFRDVGCKPTFYGIDDIERMAAALDELVALIVDFQNAWIDRYVGRQGAGHAVYATRRALQRHPEFRPEMERDAVLVAERIAGLHRAGQTDFDQMVECATLGDEPMTMRVAFLKLHQIYGTVDPIAMRLTRQDDAPHTIIEAWPDPAPSTRP